MHSAWRLQAEGRSPRRRAAEANGADGLIDRRPTVAVVLFDGDDVVVVQQQRRSIGRETVELVQEQLEPGESAGEAGERGVWEECGIRAARWAQHGSFWAAPAYSTQRVHVLSAVVVAERSTAHPPSIRVLRLAPEDLETTLDDGISLAALSLCRRSAAVERAEVR